MDAYEQIYPNLIKHNPDYPTADYLRSISFVGDEVFERVKDLRDKRWELIPGGTIMMKPDDWADTPGSDKIVEVLLEDKPDPVFIQAWGGGNTAARAFYKLKTQYPNDYKRAMSKVTMYQPLAPLMRNCVVIIKNKKSGLFILLLHIYSHLQQPRYLETPRGLLPEMELRFYSGLKNGRE